MSRIFNTFKKASTSAGVAYTKVVGKMDIITADGGQILVDGSQLSGTELGVLDGVTAGTVAASKALVANSAGCVKWTSVTPTFDDDGPWINMGSWNTGIDITSQTDHFVPIQVHLDSQTSVAKDIACARFRVDTEAANTLTAVGCLQLRQNLAHNIASSAIINASINISDAVTVGSGSLLGGYFSTEGSGAVTKAGSNDCTTLVAVNNNTGGGIDNVFIAMQNGTGTTVTDIIKAVAVHGTATNGINVVASGGSIINGIVVTNATLGVTSSRAIKVSTSQAAAAMEDGYGVVEIDHTITGTAATTFCTAALSSWVNIPSGTVGAGKYVCAQNNGIYEDAAATVTNAKLIFGMRAQKLIGDTDSLSFPFSLNTNNTAITAVFDVNNATDMGWIDGVLSSSTGDGHIPLFRDAAGVIHYVNTYVA